MTSRDREAIGPATISDVARLAHVSITTVSHVFSGKRPVADRTKRRVLDAAHELRYRPAVTARGLATGRAMALGLQFPSDGDQLLLNPYFPALLEALSAAAIQAGFTFILLPSRRTGSFPLDVLLSSQQLDGAIVVDPVPTNDLIGALHQAGLPVVTIGRFGARVRPLFVDADNEGAMRALVAHLRAAGYERPALVSLREDRYSYIADIERGFREAVAEDFAKPIIERVDDLSERAGRAAAIELLSRRRPPDAIVAAVDRQAMGVLAAAEELGLRVPDDLGVAGAGDTVMARSSRPSLTSIDVQPALLGTAAVDIVRRAIDATAATGIEPPESITIEARLAIRESTRRSPA